MEQHTRPAVAAAIISGTVNTTAAGAPPPITQVPQPLGDRRFAALMDSTLSFNRGLVGSLYLGLSYRCLTGDMWGHLLWDARSHTTATGRLQSL